MNDQGLEDTLVNTLAYLRARIAKLRDQLDAFTGRGRSSRVRHERDTLVDAQFVLNHAERVLMNPPLTNPQFQEVNEQLRDTTKTLDEIELVLAQKTQVWEVALTLWGVLVLLLAAILTYLLYSNQTQPGFYRYTGPGPDLPHSRHFLFPPDTWPTVRSVLLACCGGMVGTGILLSRVLSQLIPTRSLDPRRVLWDMVSPFFSAALAGAFFLIIRATPLALGTPTAGGPAPGLGAGSAFTLGFLIGFAPSSIVYRISGIIKAFFGTNEVAPPKVTKPQVVRVSASRVHVTTAVTSSEATRVASVTAFFQIPSGDAAFPLTRGPNNAWGGDVALPQSKDQSGQSDSNGSLIVEARDEAGNISRSDPVTMPPINQTLGTPTSGQASTTITDAGGTLTGNNGNVLLTVPAQALTDKATLTITPVTSGLPADDLHNLVPATAYKIEPPALVFAPGSAGGTLEIKYDAAQVPTGRPEAGLGIYRVVNDAWQSVPSSKADPATKTVTAPVSSAGIYAVFASN